MMWVVSAFAQSLVDDGTLVQRVEWARAFQLEQAHPYRYTAEPRLITQGWLVQVVVERWTMLPRQVGVPNLWIGDQIAGRTGWARSDAPGPFCAVFWVPGTHDLQDEPVFFGTTILPERSDDAHRDRVLKAAAALPKVPRSGIQAQVLKLPDFTALMNVAQKQCG